VWTLLECDLQESMDAGVVARSDGFLAIANQPATEEIGHERDGSSPRYQRDAGRYTVAHLRAQSSITAKANQLR
jgi:hypothetical protein